MVFFLSAAIVELDFKTARHGDYQLLQGLMSVTRTLGAARNIIEIINAPYFERHVFSAFDEREIAAPIDDSWQLNYFAVFEHHQVRSAHTVIS